MPHCFEQTTSPFLSKTFTPFNGIQRNPVRPERAPLRIETPDIWKGEASTSEMAKCEQ